MKLPVEKIIKEMKDTVTDSNKSICGCLCPLREHKSLLPLRYGNKHSSQIAFNLLDKVIINVLGQHLNLLTDLLNSLIVRVGMTIC